APLNSTHDPSSDPLPPDPLGGGTVAGAGLTIRQVDENPIEPAQRDPARASICFPQVTLEAPRLVLRAFEPGDLPDGAEAGADALTPRWLPLPRPYTEEDARAWCLVTAPAMRTAGTGVHWAVVDRAAGRVCGGIGLNRTDWAALVTEVSYWVGPWARGR